MLHYDRRRQNDGDGSCSCTLGWLVFRLSSFSFYLLPLPCVLPSAFRLLLSAYCSPLTAHWSQGAPVEALQSPVLGIYTYASSIGIDLVRVIELKDLADRWRRYAELTLFGFLCPNPTELKRNP
jgi:hypothetical protein